MNENTKITAMLIGADMNCYTMARAFYEAYGIVSNAFGRWAMGDTMYSKIVNFTAVPDIDNLETLRATIHTFAATHANSRVIVMGCTDDYVALLMELRDELPPNCVAPYIDAALRDKLVSKADFYELCDSFDIPYPKTFCAKSALPAEALTQAKLGFAYPIIIKPSSSILYWKSPFAGMKKVYESQNPAESAQILSEVYASGYADIMILQDKIPNDDSYMRVLTSYSDRSGKVKMMCLGHVGLEEHTPKALGNHAAIITEYNEPLMLKLKAFLEEIHYVGFSNFDIKLDTRDDSFRVFEINLRQGRSNYYVTGAGYNLAKLVVNDRVLEKDLGECVLNKDVFFWHSVPKSVVYRYVKDSSFIAKAKALTKAGKESASFYNAYDFKNNPRRYAYYLIHMQRFFTKFKKYCK